MVTLKSLVGQYGIEATAGALGMTKRYIKRCLAEGSTSQIRIVKLVNAANKLK